MGRFDLLRRYADKAVLGLEIAPYFNPAVPKADGYNALVVDIFDTEQLHKNALADPMIDNDTISRIEEVDIVSDASRLGEVITEKEMAGQIDYIVSSHNFEHLPNPILFLQGCSVALKPGGTITMAVPDCRVTFDHYRLPTRLADWLAAYHQGRAQPSAETLFDSNAHHAPYVLPDGTVGSYTPDHGKLEYVTPRRNLKAAYQSYVAEVEAPSEYRDAHCSLFFGPLLELMLRDLRHLGLIDLEVIEVTKTIGIEFFVYLRKPEHPSSESDDAFYTKRLELLRAINAQLGIKGTEDSVQKSSSKKWARAVLGDKLVDKVRAWNRKRRKARR